MRNIEMHCHSTLSDGKNSPGEIIEEAKRLDLDFLALTDHDTIAPEEFQSSLRSAGIETCDSVEISARNFDLSKSLHLVSYAQIFNKSLHEVLGNSVSGKMKMKWGQFAKLTYEYGFEGTQEGFDAFMKNKGRESKTSNKYNMYHYLMSFSGNKEKTKEILGELCNSNDIALHFYLECLKREGVLYNKYGYEAEEYEPSVQKTVDEVVGKSGGLVSVAHPNVTFGGSKGGIPEFERTIGDYVKKGVRGVELNTMASTEWTRAILEARRKYDLILTFGSDCHEIGYDGSDKKHSTIGELNYSLLGMGELFSEIFNDSESFTETDFGKFRNTIGLGGE